MALPQPAPRPVTSDQARIPPLVPALALFGITLLAYYPALNGGLLWDDDYHVTAPALQSWSGLWQIWFKLGATQQYYPVLHSAFWLEHRLWGESVLGYHLLNVGLHAAAACLFALTLARLRPVPGRRRGTEWLAAAVFALHPVCVESVAWISEQKNTLSLVFYLLAALAYLGFDRDRRRVWYALALGLFALALLTKSVTATLPAALLLMIAWRRGREEWRRDVFPLVPWFVVGIGSGLFTAWVERNLIGAQGADYNLNFVERGLLAGRVVWFYVGKLAWPSNLIFIYPRWHVETTWPWILSSFALVAGLVALWRLRRWSRAPLLAVLFFVGSLFPVLGFFNVYPFIFSYVADHWQYLPCLGVIALTTEGASGLAFAAIERLEARRQVVAGYGCGVAATAALALLFGLTWRQCGTYRDVTTLYTATLARNPASWLAHTNLGLALVAAGSPAEGIAHFEQAIRLNPDSADAHNNLGNALAKIPGRQAEAIAELELALRLQPDFPHAHLNLGWALANTPDRLAEGIEHLTIGLRRDPDNPALAEAHNDLGFALAKLPDRPSAAIAEYETALRLRPDYTEARINLGIALAGIGRAADAAAEFERVLKLEPENETAHNNLANVLVGLGRLPEAIGHYRAALQKNPASVEAHYNLGRTLRASGDDPGAIAQYREALRLAPRAAEIWNSLGSALYRQEQFAEAAAAYQQTVLLQPESAQGHNNFGVALTGAGRLDPAITELRAAVRLAPGYAEAHYNLAVALQQAGRLAEAAAEYKAARTGP